MAVEFNFAQLEVLLNQIYSNVNKPNKDEAFLELLLGEFSLMEQLFNFLEKQMFHETEFTPHIDLFNLLICAEKIFSLKAIVDDENQNLPWLKLEIPFVRRISQLQTYKQLVRREREVIQLTKSGKFWFGGYAEEILKVKKEFMDMYDGEEVRNEILKALKDFSAHVQTTLTKKTNSKINLSPLDALEQDISSLKKIIRQIDLAVTSPSTSKTLEKCVLQRALQVTGEFLKCTQSSAHVSKGTHDTLKTSQIPLTTLASLRDLLSRSNSLLIRKRRVLEWHDHVLKFVRDDLTKMRPIIEAILSDKETLLFLELIDAILSIHDVRLRIPYIANGLQQLRNKVKIQLDLKEIQVGVKFFLKLLEEGLQKKSAVLTEVKSGLSKILFKIRYSNWEKNTNKLLKLNVEYSRKNFLEIFSKYMKEKKRNEETPPVKDAAEVEEVRLEGTLKISKDSPSKNKPEGVTDEIGSHCTSSSYVTLLSASEIQRVKSVIESMVTRDSSEDKGQLPLNFLLVSLVTQELSKAQNYLHNLNPASQINSDSECSIIIRLKIDLKKIILTIKHKEWKEGVDKYLEFKITSKSLFETLTLNPTIQSKYETVELIIEKPFVPIPQKGILDVGKDLKITKDHDAKTSKAKHTKCPIEMSESELRKIFDDMETSLLAKTHLNREEFDALGSELWPELITKLSNIPPERVQSVTEDFCKRHGHVSSQDLYPLMMLVKRMKQIQKTSEAKKDLVEWLTLLLVEGRKSTLVHLYVYQPEPAYDNTQKIQECKGLIQHLSSLSDEDLKQLMEWCDAQKWEELLNHLRTCTDTYDIFCKVLAEFWFEGTLPTVEELSSILNLESEYTKLIVQNLEETLVEEETPRIVENKLKELKQNISSSWTKEELRKLCDKIEVKKNWYEINARMESFLTSKATGQGCSVSQEEYSDLVSHLSLTQFPDFNCNNPGTFKKFKNTWLRGQGSKQPNPYGDLIKSSASEKGFKIFINTLGLNEDQKTSLEETFRSIEMEHLNIYFLQRIELMNSMVHRYTMESVHNYYPKDEYEQTKMDREIKEHLRNSRLLAGLAYILTDLLDLLKNLGRTLKVEFLESLLTREDPRWTPLRRENKTTIQFNIRNYLAHGDHLLEVIMPELQDQILILICIKLFKDGKSLLAFMKMAMDQNMLQYMTQLEENGNAEFLVNALPESLKKSTART